MYIMYNKDVCVFLCVSSDREKDLHDKYKNQLECYEEYINELECRLRGFMRYMITDERSEQNQSSVRYQFS